MSLPRWMLRVGGSFGKEAELSQERKKLERELMKKAVEWGTKYEELVAEAMLQVRRELTFGKASKRYRAIVAESAARSEAAAKRLMDELLKDDEEESVQPAPADSSPSEPA